MAGWQKASQGTTVHYTVTIKDAASLQRLYGDLLLWTLPDEEALDCVQYIYDAFQRFTLQQEAAKQLPVPPRFTTAIATAPRQRPRLVIDEDTAR